MSEPVSGKPVMQLVDPGIYVLTKDVDNPKPDRRSKRHWKLAVKFRKGMRFNIILPTMPRDWVYDDILKMAHEKFCERARIVQALGYNGKMVIGDNNEADDLRWEVIVPHLERTYDLKSVLPESDMLPLVLMCAIDKKLLSLSQVKKLFDQTKEMSEEDLDEMYKRHGYE